MNGMDGSGLVGDAALVVVACPACHSPSAAAEADAGEAVRCPVCASAFLVPVLAAARPIHRSNDAPQPATIPDAATMPEPDAVVAVTEPGVADPRGLDESFGAAATAPAAASQADPLQFREPVRTVRVGREVIELRRLTPEELAVRRARRNILMLLTGAAVLIVLVLLFGTGGRRKGRR